uniref:Uncharacterized protein n=1 Tax=Physcomitrium patens TaxID=3218 RepID=A0A2K1IN33_PHYPA|nr:hypothetical protein PHYPA_026993 [Physcomitrium patens]
MIIGFCTMKLDTLTLCSRRWRRDHLIGCHRFEVREL